ncbi:creatininase family protein [Streptomyces lincolnensis]|uniref:creatininase family protein n=1 Tax=Streptomyces lincolnensis TaxID=1915 RepID=UPI001E65700B|nr:creatininase family protein [Streptomyces lincolnensis]
MLSRRGTRWAEVCRRAAVPAAEHTGVVVTPSVPTGLSEHHMAFGGNMTALKALTTELTTELSTPIAFAGCFGAGREVVRDTLETQDGLMHAREGETSMMTPTPS